jgi:hypothetical protein
VFHEVYGGIDPHRQGKILNDLLKNKNNSEVADFKEKLLTFLSSERKT